MPHKGFLGGGNVPKVPLGYEEKLLKRGTTRNLPAGLVQKKYLRPWEVFCAQEANFVGLARFGMWDAKALPFLAKGMNDCRRTDEKIQPALKRKILHPQWGSNPQSPGSEPDALSIRPRGQVIGMWAIRFLNGLQTLVFVVVQCSLVVVTLTGCDSSTPDSLLTDRQRFFRPIFFTSFFFL